MNRNPDNYLADVEQSSFSPSNIVPGSSWSPDKRFAEPPLKISGAADRYNHRNGNDDYTPAGQSVTRDEAGPTATPLQQGRRR